MILELIKLAAPAVLSSLMTVDDWTTPKKQENPFISITGLTLKNLGRYLLEESSDNISTTHKNDDNTTNNIYNKYINKSYNMEFK